MKIGDGVQCICLYGILLCDFQCKCWITKPLNNRDDNFFFILCYFKHLIREKKQGEIPEIAGIGASHDKGQLLSVGIDFWVTKLIHHRAVWISCLGVCALLGWVRFAGDMDQALLPGTKNRSMATLLPSRWVFYQCAIDSHLHCISLLHLRETFKWLPSSASLWYLRQVPTPGSWEFWVWIPPSGWRFSLLQYQGKFCTGVCPTEVLFLYIFHWPFLMEIYAWPHV